MGIWVFALFVIVGTFVAQTSAIGNGATAIGSPSYFLAEIYAMDTNGDDPPVISGPYCSATLITPQHVVTSGDCLKDASMMPPDDTPTSRRALENLIPTLPITLPPNLLPNLTDIVPNLTDIVSNLTDILQGIINAQNSTSGPTRTLYVALGMTNGTRAALAGLSDSTMNRSGVIVSAIDLSNVTYYTPSAADAQYTDVPVIIPLNQSVNASVYTPLVIMANDIKPFQNNPNNLFFPALSVAGWGDPTCGDDGAPQRRVASAAIIPQCSNVTVDGTVANITNSQFCVVYYANYVQTVTKTIFGYAYNTTVTTQVAVQLDKADQGAPLYLKLKNSTFVDVAIASLQVRNGTDACTIVNTAQPVMKLSAYRSFIQANAPGVKFGTVKTTDISS